MPTLDVSDRRAIAQHIIDYLKEADPRAGRMMYESMQKSAKKHATQYLATTPPQVHPTPEGSERTRAYQYTQRTGEGLGFEEYDPKDELAEWLPVVAEQADAGDENAAATLDRINEYMQSPKLQSREARERAGELSVTPVTAPPGEPVKPQYREAQRAQAMDIAAGGREALDIQGGGTPLQRQAVKNIYSAQQLTPNEQPLLPSEVLKLAAAQSYNQLEGFRQIPGGIAAAGMRAATAASNPLLGGMGYDVYNMPTGEQLQQQIDQATMGQGNAAILGAARGIAQQTESTYGPRTTSGQAFGTATAAGAAGMAPWMVAGPVGGLASEALAGTKVAQAGGALAEGFASLAGRVPIAGAIGRKVGQVAARSVPEGASMMQRTLPATARFVENVAKTGSAFRAMNLLTRYGLYGQEALQESIRSPEEWFADYAIPAGGYLGHKGAVKFGTKFNKMRADRRAQVAGAKGVPEQEAFAAGAPTFPEIGKPSAENIPGPTRPVKLAPEQVIEYARTGKLPEGYRDVREFYSDLSNDPRTRATIMRSASSPSADLQTKMLAQGVLDYEANMGHVHKAVENMIANNTMPDLRRVELSPAHLDILTEAANGAMDDPLAKNARQILNFIRTVDLEKQAAAKAAEKGGAPTGTFDIPKYMETRTAELRKEHAKNPQGFQAAAVQRFRNYNRPGMLEGKKVKFSAFGHPGFGDTQAEVEAYLRQYVGGQIKEKEIPLKAADYLAHKAIIDAEGGAPPATTTTPTEPAGPKITPPTPEEAPKPKTKEELAADIAAMRGKKGGPKGAPPTLVVPPTEAPPTPPAGGAPPQGAAPTEAPAAPTAPSPTEGAGPPGAYVTHTPVSKAERRQDTARRQAVDGLLAGTPPTLSSVESLVRIAEDKTKPITHREAAATAAERLIAHYATAQTPEGRTIEPATADVVSNILNRISRVTEEIKPRPSMPREGEAKPENLDDKINALNKQITDLENSIPAGQSRRDNPAAAKSEALKQQLQELIVRRSMQRAETKPAEDKNTIFTDEELEARRLKMEEARKKRGTKLPGGLTGPEWFDEPETMAYYSWLAGHAAETMIRKGVKITRDAWKEAVVALDKALAEMGEHLASVHLDWLWAHPQIQAAIAAVRNKPTEQAGEGVPVEKPVPPAINPVSLAHAGNIFGPTPARFADEGASQIFGARSQQAIIELYDTSMPEVRLALLRHPHSEYARAKWEEILKRDTPDLTNEELEHLWRTTNTLDALYAARSTFGTRPRRRAVISSGVAKYLAREQVSDKDFLENLYSPEMTSDTLFEALKNIEQKIYDLRDVPETEAVPGPRRRVYKIVEVRQPDGTLGREYVEMAPDSLEGASAIPKGVVYHQGVTEPSYTSEITPDIHGQRVVRYVEREVPDRDTVLDEASKRAYNYERVIVRPSPADVPIQRAAPGTPIKREGRGYEHTAKTPLPSIEARQRELFPGFRPRITYPSEAAAPKPPERLHGIRLFPEERVQEPKGYRSEESLEESVGFQRKLLQQAFGDREFVTVSDIAGAVEKLRAMNLKSVPARAARIELMNRLAEDLQRHLNFIEADYVRKGEKGIETVPAASANIALPSWRYRRGAGEPPGAWRGVTTDYMAALGEYQRMVREAASLTGKRTRERKSLLLRISAAAEELKALKQEAELKTDTALRRMEYRRDAIRERMASDRLTNPATETYFLDMPIIGGGAETAPDMLVPALPGGKLHYMDNEGKRQIVEIPREIDTTRVYTSGLFRIPTDKGVLQIPADNVIGVEQTRNYIPLGKSQLTELLRVVYERASSARRNITPEEALARREDAQNRLYAYLWTMRDKPEALAALYAYIDPELFKTQAIAGGGETSMAIARAGKEEDPMSGFREGILRLRSRGDERKPRWRNNWTLRDRIALILEQRKVEQNFEHQIANTPRGSPEEASLIAARDTYLKNNLPTMIREGMRDIPSHEIARAQAPRTTAGKLQKISDAGLIASMPEGAQRAKVGDPHTMESDIIDVLFDLRDSMAIPYDRRTYTRLANEPYLEFTGRGKRAMQEAVNYIGTLHPEDLRQLPDRVASALQQFNHPTASKEMRDFLAEYTARGATSKEGKALDAFMDALAAVVDWKNTKEAGGLDGWIELMQEKGHLKSSMPDFSYQRRLYGGEVGEGATAARGSIAEEGVDVEGPLRQTEPFVEWEDFAPYKGTKAPKATRNELIRLVEAALERPEVWLKDAKGQITDERLVKPLALVAQNTSFGPETQVEAHPLSLKLRKALETAGVDPTELTKKYAEGTPLINEVLTKHVEPTPAQEAQLVMNQDISAGDVVVPGMAKTPTIPEPADLFKEVRGLPRREAWNAVKPLFYQVRAVAEARGEAPPTASEFLKRVLTEPEGAVIPSKQGPYFPSLKKRTFERKEKLRGRGRYHIAKYSIDSPMGRFVHNLFLESDKPGKSAAKREKIRELAFGLFENFIATQEAVKKVSEKQTRKAGVTLFIPQEEGRARVSDKQVVELTREDVEMRIGYRKLADQILQANMLKVKVPRRMLEWARRNYHDAATQAAEEMRAAYRAQAPPPPEKGYLVPFQIVDYGFPGGQEVAWRLEYATPDMPAGEVKTLLAPPDEVHAFIKQIKEAADESGVPVTDFIKSLIIDPLSMKHGDPAAIPRYDVTDKLELDFRQVERSRKRLQKNVIDEGLSLLDDDVEVE